MKQLGNVFSAISASFALIPGIAVLTTNLGVPPGASQVIFGASIESICVLILLALWVNRQKIKQLSIKSVTKYASILGVAFIVLFISYLFLYGYYVAEMPHTADLLFPIWSAGELAEGLKQYGSQIRLVEAWGRDDVYKVIQSSSPIGVQFTIIVFLLTYMGIFATLTAGFGILGIKVAKTK